MLLHSLQMRNNNNNNNNKKAAGKRTYFCETCWLVYKLLIKTAGQKMHAHSWLCFGDLQTYFINKEGKKLSERLPFLFRHCINSYTQGLWLSLIHI